MNLKLASIPSGKLTVCELEHGHRNSWFTMIYLLKVVLFHSYVSLPEGNCHRSQMIRTFWRCGNSELNFAILVPATFWVDVYHHTLCTIPSGCDFQCVKLGSLAQVFPTDVPAHMLNFPMLIVEDKPINHSSHSISGISTIDFPISTLRPSWIPSDASIDHRFAQRPLWKPVSSEVLQRRGLEDSGAEEISTRLPEAGAGLSWVFNWMSTSFKPAEIAF